MMKCMEVLKDKLGKELLPKVAIDAGEVAGNSSTYKGEDINIITN